PNQTNGLITITGVPPTPSPTPTATATATASPIPTPTSTPSPTATPCGMPGAWTIVANYPVSIESSAVGTDGTFAYSAGGYAGGASNALYRYDPIANSWTTFAPTPVSLYDARGVYAANTNSFYVFGGT